MRYKITFLLVLLLLNLSVVTPSFAATNNSEGTLTLQQAIEMGLNYDRGVKVAEAEVDRTWYIRDDAADKIDFYAVPGATNYSQEYQVSWNTLLNADLNWRMSKKTLETTRDTLALKICQSYWNVQTAEDKVHTQELIEQQALANLQNARAALLAGTVAPSDVIYAETQWQQAKSNLDAARHSLDDAYSALNQLIGLDPGARPRLVDMPEYEPLKVDNLETEVERIVSGSPSVWLAQQKVTIQEWAADMMMFTGQYSPYKAREIAVDQAELNAANTREIMKQVTRSIYYATMEIEKSYEAAKEGLRKAEENLRVAKAKYDAGTAIKTDVVAAEVAVAQAQQAINDLTRQHAYMKLAFQKPWAASGSGSGSSATGAGK
jgi:outer membrane protein TolC